MIDWALPGYRKSRQPRLTNCRTGPAEFAAAGLWVERERMVPRAATYRYAACRAMPGSAAHFHLIPMYDWLRNHAWEGHALPDTRKSAPFADFY